MAVKRRTRAEMKAATRERLLVAAERIAIRKGFAALSLERVAEAAGVTKGAVYSSFASKEDFLLEVMTRLTPRLDFNYEIADAKDPMDLLVRLADDLATLDDEQLRQAALAFEFDAMALRDPKLRRAMAAVRGRVRTDGQPDPFEPWIAAHQDELPLPAEEFFAVINAVALGIVMRRLLDGPESYSDDLIDWTLRRLLPPRQPGGSSG